MEYLRERSSLTSVQLCRLIPVEEHIGAKLSVGEHGAHFGGLKRCSSPWACPMCAARVGTGRVEEMVAAVRAWQAKGGTVAMVTLTMRHSRSDALLDLFEAKGKAWTAVRESRAVRDATAREGLAGWVHKSEATVGEVNGWHLHVHVLMFFEGGDLAAPQRWVDVAFPRWRATLARRGLEPDERHGVSVEVVRPDTAGEQVARYVAKDGGPSEALRAAMELGAGLGKLGRDVDGKRRNVSTWELLGAATNGDRRAAALWAEWELASKGRQQLVWARGFRDRLGLADRTDEALAAVEEPATPILLLHPDLWKAVRRNGHVPLLLEATEDAYEVGGLGLAQRAAVAWIRHRYRSDWGVVPLPLDRAKPESVPPPPLYQQMALHLGHVIGG